MTGSTSTYFVVSTGYENSPISLSVDPPPSDAGGAFMDLSAGFLVNTEIGTRLRLLTGARSTWEGFANAHDRMLQGHLIWTELAYVTREALRFRCGLAGDYFDDSFLGDLERYGITGEVAVGLFGSAWEGELIAGMRGTHHPGEFLSETGLPVSSYARREVSGGIRIAGCPAERVALRGSLVRRWTDAGASLPDFYSWAIGADLEAGLGTRLHVDGMAMFQPRSFVGRNDEDFGDDSVQFGVGAGLLLQPRTGIHLRWSEARYQSPEGSEHDTQRVELSLELGGFMPSSRPKGPLLWDPGVWEDAQEIVRHREGTGVHFRLIAPQATSVTVSGDFNGWNGATHCLESTDDGTWELIVEIPPGNYQYVYLVDGRAWTPPEAVVTFDDGFGGRNGLLEVDP